MLKLKRFLRGSCFFLLYVFLYLWSGAAYKLVYNLAHEKSATIGAQGQLKTMQNMGAYQMFRLDASTRLTYLFGSDFGRYIGPNPSLREIFQESDGMNKWVQKREENLIALADEQGDSLWADNALRDASLLGFSGRGRGPVTSPESPPIRQVVWFCTAATEWHWSGLPEMKSSSREAAERLIHNFPESPFVPQAMAESMEQYRQTYDFARVNEIAHQLVEEHPTSNVTLQIAFMLAHLHAFRGEYAQAAKLLAPVLDGAEDPTTQPQEQLELQRRRLDLASYYLAMNRPAAARAQYEHAARVLGQASVQHRAGLGLEDDEALPEDEWKRKLEGLQEGLQTGLQEVWVAELFEALEVPDAPESERDEEPLYSVRGQVLHGKRPLAGIRVGLPVQGVLPGRTPHLQELPTLGAQNADYFATTDAQGRFALNNIPAGEHGLILLADLKFLGSSTVLVATPAPVVIKESDVELAPIRFGPAMASRSLDPQTVPEKGSLTLRWEPFPGAVRYEVFAAPDHYGDERSPAHWRMRGQGHPSPAEIPEECWHRTVRQGAQVQVPLEELRQGDPPQRSEREGDRGSEGYYWLVAAFDAQDRLLSSSATYEHDQWPQVMVRTEEGLVHVTPEASGDDTEGAD